MTVEWVHWWNDGGNDFGIGDDGGSRVLRHGGNVLLVSNWIVIVW